MEQARPRLPGPALLSELYRSPRYEPAQDSKVVVCGKVPKSATVVPGSSARRRLANQEIELMARSPAKAYRRCLGFGTSTPVHRDPRRDHQKPRARSRAVRPHADTAAQERIARSRTMAWAKRIEKRSLRPIMTQRKNTAAKERVEKSRARAGPRKLENRMSKHFASSAARPKTQAAAEVAGR